MTEFKYVIADIYGIHARPAGLLVKKAAGFNSVVTIEADGKSADAKSILALMSLGAKKGTEITVKIEGSDEKTAAEQLESFFKENL